MTGILRAVAIAIAAVAAIDPAISLNRSRPLAVEFATGASADAEDVRRRLLSEFGEDVTVARQGQAEAVVVIDEAIDPRSIRENVTVSTLSVTPSPNLRLKRAASSSRFLLGHEASIAMDVEVRDLAGRTSVLTVTQQGIEVGRMEHTWTNAARQRVSVPFVTFAAGTHVVRVSATPVAGETRQDDNALDARVVVLDRPLRVAFIEPRPSWSAGFVRRALEQDPTFEIASVVRASRGIDIRSANAPAAVTASALERFEVVVAGAPEELRTADLEAMQSFMAERGGTAVFVPDRRPSGPYARFISAAAFDEVVLDTPVALASADVGPAPRASELAIPRSTGRSMRSLMSLPGGRPAVAAWPVGAGTLIFSGALDAWRFRDDDGDRFAKFWRSSIAAAALRAPPPVRVEVEPAVVKPGREVRVVARIRATELEHDPDGSMTIPEVSAAAIQTRAGSASSNEPVRLWPTAEWGVFDGSFTPARSGPYHVHVSAGRAQGSAAVLEAPMPMDARADHEDGAIISSSTGGAVATAEDLSPIVEHLKSIPRRPTPVTVYPMRSSWWTLPFALALCGEWTLRRRRGLR